jgi:hypothetical protein
MAPRDAAPAVAPRPDVEVELPVDGLARDLGLERPGDGGLVAGAAAVGATAGHGRLGDLVDRFGAGRRAMGLGAVVLARLTAGRLRVRWGLALGGGSGLARAGTAGRVELVAEAVVLGLQVGEASRKGLAAGTREGLHASIIGEAGATAALTPTAEQGSV